MLSNLVVFGVFWLLFDLNETSKDASMLDHTDSERFRVGITM